MKTLFLASTALLASLPALADISIECKRADRTYVSVADVRGGYDLDDTGDSLLQDTKGIKASKETGNSLEFILDRGTSIKSVYSFKGLRECESEGTSNKVELKISSQGPVGPRELVEQLRCECAAD